MCLVVFAWQAHPRYRLIVAANRDELHARPADAMHWWPAQPGLLAGRDREAGGTWLAVSRGGRFATVTNFRERLPPEHGRRSRGELVQHFVAGSAGPGAYTATLDGGQYAGYCLLTADAQELRYSSNRDDASRSLAAGIYGLSNAALDTPWPKLLRCRDGLARLVAQDEPDPEALLALLADTAPADGMADDALPADVARAVSAPFVRHERYGTRCTTVVMLAHDGDALVVERRFDATGLVTGEDRFRFATVGRDQASATP